MQLPCVTILLQHFACLINGAKLESFVLCVLSRVNGSDCMVVSFESTYMQYDAVVGPKARKNPVVLIILTANDHFKALSADVIPI